MEYNFYGFAVTVENQCFSIRPTHNLEVILNETVKRFSMPFTSRLVDDWFKRLVKLLFKFGDAPTHRDEVSCIFLPSHLLYQYQFENSFYFGTIK
jgi:hypothetical protein